MRRATALALALSLLTACDEGAATNTLAIELVAAQDLNPTDVFDASHVLVRIEQDGSEVAFSETLSGSAFSFDREIESLALSTRIHVALEDDGELVAFGATPPFYPLFAGVVRIPLGAPGSCEALLEPRLPSVRLDPAVFPLSGHRWLVFGGATHDGGGHDEVGALVPLWLTIDLAFSENQSLTEIVPLDRSLRDTQLVSLTSTRVLVMGTDDGGSGVAYVVESQSTTRDLLRSRVADAPNVGAGATLVSLGELGAAVVGGGAVVDRSDFITWVGSSGAVVATTTMQTARRRPAVAVIGNGGLLIAGGQDEGEPELEFVPFRGASVPVSGSGVLARERPAIARPPVSVTAAAGAALVIGGEDAAGEPLDTTLLVTGCPSACTVTAGPTWERPRRAPTVLATRERTWLLGGSSPDGSASGAVDVVVFAGTDAGTIQLQQDRSLENPRARGTAVELDSGIVVLLGGERGPDDPLQTFEMCWPQTLEGVDFP